MPLISRLAHVAVATIILHVAVPGMAQIIETRPEPPPVQVEDKRPATAVNLARPASPKNKRGWMSRILEAYPQEARLAQWEGRVGVSVEVDMMGRARSCQVTQSSGHAILDESACAGMIRYARFEPALYDDGQPMVGNYQTWVPYLLKSRPFENWLPE